MMRVLVWVTEVGWEAAVDAARGVAGPTAGVTLLHVTPAEVEDAVEAPRRGLLGRRPPPPAGHGPPPPPPGHHPAHPDVRAALGEEADAILAAAAERLDRPAERRKRTGRPEREVLDEAAGQDLLVLSRDGAPSPGPASLAPWARFVLDHAKVPVLLASPR
jgi:nucleotide-binding universal stress UspA family protein